MWWEISKHLEVKKHELFIGGIATTSLTEEYGTPLYIYNFDRVTENIARIRKAFSSADIDIKIYYATKANPSLALLKFLIDKVDGIDAASPNEMKATLQAGFSSSRIMLTAPGLSNGDLREIIKKKIIINLDSFSQLEKLARLIKDYPISFRLNPTKGAGLHKHVITAGKYVKFGIKEEKIIRAYKKALELGLRPVGLQEHIGSGWLGKDVKLFLDTVRKLVKIAKEVNNFTKLKFLDFGGGPGVPYKKQDKIFPLSEYARGIAKETKSLETEIRIEPGRYLVGDSGILLMKVEHISEKEKYVPVATVNAGFNVFRRPFTYGAYHEIVACSKADAKTEKGYMIAGNLCESGDVFNESREKLRRMPALQEGEILALLNAGAYGFAMSSQFNLRLRPAEVAIVNGKVKLIRKRENYKDWKRNQLV